MPISCIGTAARSDSSSVVTNSEVCSSPTVRLPMSRTASDMETKRIIVRISTAYICITRYDCSQNRRGYFVSSPQICPVAQIVQCQTFFTFFRLLSDRASTGQW